MEGPASAGPSICFIQFNLCSLVVLCSNGKIIPFINRIIREAGQMNHTAVAVNQLNFVGILSSGGQLRGRAVDFDCAARAGNGQHDLLIPVGGMICTQPVA